MLVISRCRDSLGEYDSLHQRTAAVLLLDRGPEAHLHRQRRHELEVTVQGYNAEKLLLHVHGRHLTYFNNKKPPEDIIINPLLAACSKSAESDAVALSRGPL